ncbi:Uncharacterized protein SCF082_LOCUS48584 [Durusdinium trenchii]|uniref:Mitogen-activated protein kinase n=1 Tax=Durusdinium trenchii TaxID=1381693 RepID=A0ABP0RVM7_9DINO
MVDNVIAAYEQSEIAHLTNLDHVMREHFVLQVKPEHLNRGVKCAEALFLDENGSEKQLTDRTLDFGGTQACSKPARMASGKRVPEAAEVTVPKGVPEHPEVHGSVVIRRVTTDPHRGRPAWFHRCGDCEGAIEGDVKWVRSTATGAVDREVQDAFPSYTAAVGVPAAPVAGLSTWSARPAPLELAVGIVVRIGAVQCMISEPLGMGSFGVVWAAKTSAAPQEVAVKEMICNSDTELGRAERGAETKRGPPGQGLAVSSVYRS